MAYKKNTKEIERILEGGKLLGEILEKLSHMVEPGMNALDIDQEAERMIREVGGLPAFKGYQPSKNAPPFPGTICASLNEELVHGIPTKEKIFQNGDIFSIDIGMKWPANSGEGVDGHGYVNDTAITIPVGEIDPDLLQLLRVTQKSLYYGIEEAKAGNTIADIGKRIQKYVEPQGYGIIKDLCGHGVGHYLHEEPTVLNYYSKEMELWEIKPGVVIAIEPMISLGSPEVEVGDDKWGICCTDRKLNAHFEHTVVVTENGPQIATRRPSENISS